MLFRDGGFTPVLDGDSLQVGPGELALVGFGSYASPANDLGIEPDVVIPRVIAPLPASFHSIERTGKAQPIAIETLLTPPNGGDLRIVLKQRDSNGAMARSRSDASMGKFLLISAEQDGRPLPVEIGYDKVIWSGLAWAVGEIRHQHIAPGVPIRIHLSSAESEPSLHLEGNVYQVDYANGP